MKEEIASWWSTNPMTYGLEHGEVRYGETEPEIGSPEFFAAADHEFYDWNSNLHREGVHFSALFPYERLVARNVLEIGCGMGCMAMNWAKRGANVTAVDLSPKSIEMTTRRFELNGLPIRAQQTDANSLPFAADEFQYAYSWGVLHHSPNMQQSISELFRVLSEGGEFGIMVYNRHSILNFYQILYQEGFLHFESNFLSELELSSRYTDGATKEGNPYTKLFTASEMMTMIRPFAPNVRYRLLGTDLDPIFKHLLPGLGHILPRAVKKVWARRFGWSIWLYGRKEGQGGERQE